MSKDLLLEIGTEEVPAHAMPGILDELAENAKKALDAMMVATTETLKKGEKVSLLGFGTFSVSERPARKGRNPRTGEVIKIKAKKSVKFKAGSGLDM